MIQNVDIICMKLPKCVMPACYSHNWPSSPQFCQVIQKKISNLIAKPHRKTDRIRAFPVVRLYRKIKGLLAWSQSCSSVLRAQERAKKRGSSDQKSDFYTSSTHSAEPVTRRYLTNCIHVLVMRRARREALPRPWPLHLNISVTDEEHLQR